MKENMITTKRAKTLSILQSNDYVINIADFINNYIYFEYADDNLETFGPDAIISANNNKKLLTSLIFDDENISLEVAQREIDITVRTYPIAIGPNNKGWKAYHYLYHKRDFKKYAPYIQLSCLDEQNDIYWLVINNKFLDSIKNTVKRWLDWIDSDINVKVESLDDLVKLTTPISFHDQMVALYLLLADCKQKNLKLFVSGGDEKQLFGALKYLSIKLD